MSNAKLQPFIGKWRTRGSIEKTPFGSAGELRGFDSYEWFDRKDFVIHRVDVKMGRKKITNCEVICFDAKKKRFAMYAFDQGAVAGLQYGKLDGRRWSVDDKGIRFRGEFDRSHKSLIGEWQYKSGSAWKRWMTLELSRIR